MKHAIYLRRRSRIALPTGRGDSPLPLHYVASVSRDLEALGYAPSPELLEAMRGLSLEALGRLHQQLVTTLERELGAHRRHKPFYPNFPKQVMRMDEAELYCNALLHYWTSGKYQLRTVPWKRPPLLGGQALKRIELGSDAEFEALFTQLVSANSSLSEQDSSDVSWFVSSYGDEIRRLLPEAVPQKETAAFLGALLLRHTADPLPLVESYCRTATDVLRLAVAMSEGDLSLAEPTRVRSFTRRERRMLLTLLERRQRPVEDMLRWKERWIRLGERLHPTEMRSRYPRAGEAFDILRNDLPCPTFASVVENAVRHGDVWAAVGKLTSRPGELARRLDHLLRLAPATGEAVVEQFRSVASHVSTPVLLAVRHHFHTRHQPRPLRVFFPKGNLAKSHAEPNRLPPIADEACDGVVAACDQVLLERFSTLEPLGRCYLDEQLCDYPVPFAGRSASRSYRTVARGSRMPLPEGCRVLRFFVWWKNGRSRTDIDLSAALFDAEFIYNDVLSYYNLKNFGGVHSGDIVDAPDGASEFIDVELARLTAAGVRYMVMTLHSYTCQPYAELPECFAGWMSRRDADSGEIFEPRTVQDRLDLTAQTKQAIPLIIDVTDRSVIWCDLAVTNLHWLNNHVDANLGGIVAALRSLTDVNKPNLYELFSLHIRARGERVHSEEDAESVFSVAAGTPFRQEEISSGFLC